MLSSIALTLTGAIETALSGSSIERRNESASTLVGDSFNSVGYTRGNPYGLALGAERNVVHAYGMGLWRGYHAEGSAVTGLTHKSVLDDRTTVICRPRDGLSLPINHPYWRTNWPPLHWKCRSIILPIMGMFVPSEKIPDVPPDAGFGLSMAL